MSSETCPEKFAIYFSTMNSLSSKIFSEVQLIDESIRYTTASKGLTYNERCAVVDKCLIHDALKSKLHQEPIHEQIVKNPKSEAMLKLEQKLLEPAAFQDECLDQPQTDSLIRFVYPKKPEKYVFDENGCWIDEYSEPFSYSKESQVKCCQLEEFAKKIPSDRVRVRDLHKNLAYSKARSVEQNHKLEEEESKPRRERKKSKAPFFGVNVMGGLIDSTESVEDGGGLSAKHDQKERRRSFQQSDPVQNEENLPKQKQNLDLIAELQAKLDKNKIAKNMNCPPPPPPPQGHPTPRGTSTTVASPTTVGKISKPKAPPPPPPNQNIATAPANARKTIEKESLSKSKPTSEIVEAPKPSAKKNEEFLVDVSSPCRIVS